MKFNEHNLPYSTYNDLSKIRDEWGYTVVEISKIQGLLPEDLLKKCNSALIVCSGITHPLGYEIPIYMVNLLRVDGDDIDQEPLICMYDPEKQTAIGGMVHHGDWDGRTTQVDPEFHKAVTASGITAVYPLKALPTTVSGTLSELPVDHEAAFQVSWGELNK